MLSFDFGFFLEGLVLAHTLTHVDSREVAHLILDFTQITAAGKAEMDLV
jgi:hypothetical protein